MWSRAATSTLPECGTVGRKLLPQGGSRDVAASSTVGNDGRDCGRDCARGPTSAAHTCLAIVRVLLTVSSWMKHHCITSVTLMCCGQDLGRSSLALWASSSALLLVCVFILYTINSRLDMFMYFLFWWFLSPF